MTSLYDLLTRVGHHLDQSEISWALVGGLAVGARTEPRFTRDVDLAIAVDDDRQAEQVVKTMLELGYQLSALLEQMAVGRLATVRFLPPGEDRLVDLLFASSGIEPEIVAQSQRINVLEGAFAPVARLGHLIAMKILARDDRRRPQDRVDLEGLLRGAPQEELAACRAGLQLIMDRGFHRERDLLAELSVTLEEFA